MNPPEPGLVSVVVPVYNGAAHLLDALMSVEEQTYPARELIVIDDGSTDGSDLVASTFAEQRPWVQAVPQANAGVAAARNHGVRLARGELVAFLDCDDLWYPHKLEEQVSFLRSHPGHVAVGCLMQYVGARGPLRGVVGEPAPADRQDDVRRARFLPFVISSMVARSEDVLGVGGFDERLQADVPGLVEDLDLVARLARRGLVATLVGEPLGAYRLHGSGASARAFRSQRLGTRYVRERLAAEDAGSELIWDEFARRGLSMGQRYDDICRYQFRRAGVTWAEGRRAPAVARLVLAFLLNPRFTSRRLRQRVRGATPGIDG